MNFVVISRCESQVTNITALLRKSLGDANVSIFDPPFCREDLTTLFKEARNFSYEVLRNLDDCGIKAKLALHDGEIVYYSPIANYYVDYTAVGEPLTELFQLDGVAKSGYLCVYSDANYLKLIKAQAGSTKFKRNPEKPKKLQGIGLRNITYLSTINDE